MYLRYRGNIGTMTTNQSFWLNGSGNATNATDSSTVIITHGPLFNIVERRTFAIFVYPFLFIISYIIIGLIGNSFVLYVFSFKWRKNKNTVFIMTLATLDIISCTVNMPVEATILYRFINFDFDLLCKISRFTSYIVSASYSFVLVAIAVDRYIMVCRPFTGMNLTIPFAKRTCIGAILLSLATQWPSLFLYGTFTFHIPIPSTDNSTTSSTKIVVEAKTCLVSNEVIQPGTDQKTYLYAFYAFLFIGHVIIFISFISVYIHIGRKLFMASQIHVHELKSKPTLWRQSVVSALTGAIPKNTLCSRGSRTMSSDNVSIQAKRPYEKRRRNLDSPQPPGGDKVDGVFMVEKNSAIRYSGEHSMEQETETDLGYVEDLAQSDIGDKNKDTYSVATISDVCETRPGSVKSRDSATRLSDISSKRSSARDTLRLTLGFDATDSDPRFSKTSNSSGGSERPLVPMSPLTAIPNSAQPLLQTFRRSQSEDLTGRLSVTQINGLRRMSGDIKEISLKQNTLIMRMVTFCFMLSYLPFLVLVFVRYVHPEIPGSLDGISLIVYHIFLRSYFFNSVIRPFIYIIMNDEYRTKVWNLLRCRTVY